LLHTRKSAAAGCTGSTAQAPAMAAKAQICWAARRRLVLVDRRFMPGGCNCRNESRPVNDDGAEIIDTGGGRPRVRIADPHENAGGIVV
jgi:hypothetical protein